MSNSEGLDAERVEADINKCAVHKQIANVADTSQNEADVVD